MLLHWYVRLCVVKWVHVVAPVWAAQKGLYFVMESLDVIEELAVEA